MGAVAEQPPVARMVARMNAFDQLPAGVQDALRQCVLKLDPQMALRHYNSLLRYGAAAAERDTIAQIWRHGGKPHDVPRIHGGIAGSRAHGAQD